MKYPFVVPRLSYDYDALAPSISAEVMKLHHTKHHQTYVDKLNQALEQHVDLQEMPLETLLGSLDSLPDDIATGVRNNGGGHYNHSLFWQCMSPRGGGEPSGELAAVITKKYGSYQAFVDEFTTKSLDLFGSGWCWLMPDGTITTTQNQDSPLMEGASAPLMGLDVWEHAYYLDYKNVRADYVKAWWDVVDWEFVAERYRR